MGSSPQLRGLDGFDVAYALGISPDGATVFVTGSSQGTGTGDDYATVAYDAATGAELWVARYTLPGLHSDYANDLGISPDGATVFITGWSEGAGTGGDYATVAYDPVSGAELWVARYTLPGLHSDTANGLGVSPDGSRVFVTGSSSVAGFLSDDYATVAYDAATGAELWAARYTLPGLHSDHAHALGVSPDGSAVFVTGSSQGAGTGDDYATVAYDAATGAELWVARYTLPGRHSDYAYTIGISADGSAVFVTGSSEGAGTGIDYATVAYDAVTGAELWVARYTLVGRHFDYAYAIGISSHGSTVFVTGSSQGPETGIDYATVAYDAATGTEQWVARYNGPGP